MLVPTVIIVDPPLVHENASLVEKGAVWTPLVHENVDLVENSGQLCRLYNEKSTEFLQCFFAPELGLEPRTL